MLLSARCSMTNNHNTNNNNNNTIKCGASSSPSSSDPCPSSPHQSHPTSSVQNDMLFCDVLSTPRPATRPDHIPSDLPVRLDDTVTPSCSPPPADSLLCPPSLPARSRSLGAPPAPFSRSLGRSLGGSYADEDVPLPIATVSRAAPELRTWRITSAGLVSTMGAFLDKPKTNKDNDSGVGQGLKYAMASMQGWRVDMEDAHVAELSMGDALPFSRWSFFAVFDGHAGSVAAEYAASIVMETLKESEELQKAAALAAIRDGRLCEESCQLLEEGLKAGFLTLDDKIRHKLDTVLGKDRSGTTAVCSIVTPSHVVLANLGDSRAVLSRRDISSFGTEDHKPSNEKERQRIINAGGSVMIQRINGSLAVSRALGDFEYKGNSSLSPAKQQVSPEPDVYFFDRQASDEYLIIACDGIYDVMSNDELCGFVHARLEVTKEGALSKVCNEVLDACLQKGSRDNMTLLLVCFEGAPVMHEERAAEEEKQLTVIRTALTEIIHESVANGDAKEELCVEYVLRTLNSTRPEAVPVEGHIRLLVRSIAESVIAELKGAAAAADVQPGGDAAAPASPGIPAQ
ncbi:hypothetical protein PENTCL1PPCAC_1206 [Pristionchus entomophagus]|uniref:PPM-type phosphatase domain-containing protein n=1 Tax=Pristionchus entomophagus TaxID=358040 RepID=A0AAV5S7U7_9BILA|nr:hypothetical protein PENTCL1PPCAC_1206 [Pristionchus entomophagus]